MKVIWITLLDLKEQSKSKILKEFGYRVFDGLDIVLKKQNAEIWNNLFLRRSEPDWEKYLKDYDALILSIGIHYLKEISQVFPDAKIIVEDLDAETSLMQFRAYQNLVKQVRFLRFNKVLRRGYFIAMKAMYLIYKDDFSDENINQVHRSFKEEVINLVPKENLILLNNEMNWQQLSIALDKPMPSIPYPLDTKGNSFSNRIKNILIKSFSKYWYIYFLYFGTLIGIIVYLVFYY